MSPNRAKILNIVISIIFAAAMIVSSLLLNKTVYYDHSQSVVLFLIALWFIPFSYLSKFEEKRRKTHCN